MSSLHTVYQSQSLCELRTTPYLLDGVDTGLQVVHCTHEVGRLYYCLASGNSCMIPNHFEIDMVTGILRTDVLYNASVGLSHLVGHRPNGHRFWKLMPYWANELNCVPFAAKQLPTDWPIDSLLQAAVIYWVPTGTEYTTSLTTIKPVRHP